MAIGFFRVGKLAMATVGTVWTVSNVESLYSQTKHLFLPSSYPFLLFHVILLTILFKCSSLASKFNHLLLKLLQSTATNSARNSIPPVHEDQLPRSFSDIWHRLIGLEHTRGEKEDGDHLFGREPAIEEEDQFAYLVEGKKEGDEVITMEEDVEEDGGNSMEETWKAIMEEKQQAVERELKKRNTWAVSPTIEQLKGKPCELESTKSFALGKENGGGGGRWGWRRMEVVLTHEELNQRAEEFITKIKHNIRLERLESYNLFLQLINRRGD